ncbi:hypothetical protein F5884DRAFT_658332 [Xylogone sp. PMI_703]|nr:hypothetical protein F5884DRAFT_658332 [Xylogone sp. PMI_703]
MASIKTTRPPRPHLTSLMYSIPFKRLKDILKHVIPNATLETVDDLPSTQLTRLYTLNMSDNRRLLLSFAPSLAVKLLRHEATILSSEARLIEFLSGPKGDSGQPSPLSTTLSTITPKLLKHSSNNKEMAYPYSIFEQLDGVPLSTISIYLGLPERRAIEKQLGAVARELASIKSPSGDFGPVNRVLMDESTTTEDTEATESLASSSSYKTWSEAFHSIFEGVLRDGEDMVVLLPYEAVREHFGRLSYHLDTVTSPRLLILDAGNETNLMIQREIGNDNSVEAPSTSARLTGLRNWSQGIFGDPLLSSCFENPSESFLEGWGEGGDDIIEDKETQEVRMLLYRCFRATLDIVTVYYRPQGDSSRKELEARRRLTKVLEELEKMEPKVVDTSKRSSSPSASSISKKPKVSAEE